MQEGILNVLFVICSIKRENHGDVLRKRETNLVTLRHSSTFTSELLQTVLERTPVRPAIYPTTCAGSNLHWIILMLDL
jgi:hypothetical protein